MMTMKLLLPLVIVATLLPENSVSQCMDRYPYWCPLVHASLCNLGSYKQVVQERCPKLCGKCPESEAPKPDPVLTYHGSADYTPGLPVIRPCQFPFAYLNQEYTKCASPSNPSLDFTFCMTNQSSTDQGGWKMGWGKCKDIECTSAITGECSFAETTNSCGSKNADDPSKFLKCQQCGYCQTCTDKHARCKIIAHKNQCGQTKWQPFLQAGNCDLSCKRCWQ